MDNSANMLQLCRLCLVKDEVNIPIFEEQGDIRQIFQKISSCLPVKVSQDDKLPKKICDGCSYKLDMCYEFWNTSANTEKQLLSWLSNLDVSEKLNDVQTPAGPQPAKPTDTDTIVKQEEIDPSDVQKEEEDDEEKGYMFQQNLEENNAGPSAAAAVAETNEDEPPPKRQRRTAAVKAAIAMDNDSDDDDDSGEPITKMEDESEDSDGDDNEPSYADVPSTSADDQPGPSGVGKDGADAPYAATDEFIKEITNIQCGMCSEIFSTKQKFLQHSAKLIGGAYQCCKCKAKFKECTDLYKHFNTHRTIQDPFETEEVVLNYENSEVVVQQNANDTNELLYILDDSSCVNEVVIEGEQPTLKEQHYKCEKDAIEIVNFEHGYVMNSDRYFEEEIEDEDGNIIVRRRMVVPNKDIQTQKMFSQPKPRAPQPKKRHDVPDFSATNYMFIEANQEIEVPHYKCLRCEQLFINKFVFFRHIEKGKCYINNCDVCTATFSKNNEFYKHYVAEHTDRAICNFCFRTFMYEKNVKEHMLRHLCQFRHRCEDCNKGFYTVREYRNHYKNRHMGIRHKCEVCGRSFADEYYFKRHIATHAKANKITVLQITN